MDDISGLGIYWNRLLYLHHNFGIPSGSYVDYGKPLLCLGATGAGTRILDFQVKLESQKDYSYPYVVLCPPTWLDAGKAFSMGLTIQELQYSLGYFDSEASAPPNATFAKAQLERYFREHNVTSVADFYKSIAVDLEIDQDDAEHENRTASSSFCDGCNETVNAQKIFISPYGICYAYKFLPLDSRHRGWATWSTTRSLSVKVADKTKEVYTHGSNWQLYFMPDLELVQPTSLSLTLQSEAFYLIKVNVDKIVAMPSDKNPCKPPEELNDGDSPDACIAECMNAQARKKFGCSLLPWSTGIIKRPIMEFCNSFDFNTSSGTGAIKNLTAEIERSNMSVCFDQCPFGCEQTIHDSHFVFHGPINPEYYSIVNLTRQLNMTFINVAFTSSALSQGGVLTIREYSTFSFSTFVANVGGTLGLFVGCTILTLAQVVLSLISYFCFRSKGTVDEHH